MRPAASPMRLMIVAICLAAVTMLCASVVRGEEVDPAVTAALEDLNQRAVAEGWTFTVGPTSGFDKQLIDLTPFMPSRASGPPAALSWEGPPPDWNPPAVFVYDRLKVLPPIRDQGRCGSCWAFATVGTMECVMWAKHGVKHDLSEQHLVSCTDWGCAGGFTALDYFQNIPDACGRTGAVLEAAMPYQASDTVPCDCTAPRMHWIEEWDYITWAWGMPDIEDLKWAIYHYGPVACVIDAGDGLIPPFAAYNGGIFNACEPTPYTYNHMVVLVGWNDNDGSEGIWYLRNSWGTDWGENGYMRIEYGCSGVGTGATWLTYNYNLDSDGDGIVNRNDNCVFAFNPDQIDYDIDLWGDSCDNCPLVFNLMQDDVDNDDIGDECDECTDTDHDGFGNPGYPATICALDNCPTSYNPTQVDGDTDGAGDICDNCATIYNPDQGNVDNDTKGNLCDNCPFTYGYNQLDSDGDGFGNVCEVAADWQAWSGLFPDQVCPPWTLTNTADVELPTLADSNLTMLTSDTAEQMYYSQVDPQFVYPENGLEIDFKMKYVSGYSNLPGETNNAVKVVVGTTGTVLWIGADQIFLWSSWGTIGSTASVDTDEAPHWYRIAVDESGNVSVYHDFTVVLTGSVFGYGGWSAPELAWGDVSYDAYGQSEWLFFRHNGYVDNADTDRDGIFNVCDNCPTVANANQADGDGDGVGDVCDNCVAISNPDQANADGDALGDLCDACPYDPDNDIDSDGLCADVDNCPNAHNPDQADADLDGVGDACDPLLVPSQFATIQVAIDTIGPGGTVLLEPGTYSGTGNYDLSYHGKAITVTSQEGPQTTIINCQNLGRAFSFTNGETNSSVLSSVWIKNGSATGSWGGAIYMDDTSWIEYQIIGDDTLELGVIMPSSPTIEGCIISDCSADKGGAIATPFVTSARIMNCTVTKNAATQGAGIYLGGISANMEVTRCVIAHNNGVGIYNASIHVTTPLDYTCNVFWENAGGNVYNLGGSGEDNRTINPRFCDVDDDIFTVDIYSPCLAFRSPCEEAIGALGGFCETPYANRGDLDLNLTPWEASDDSIFMAWLDQGDAAYTVDVEAQRRASDFNCDGLFETVADQAYFLGEGPSYDCPPGEPEFSAIDKIQVLDTTFTDTKVHKGVNLYLKNTSQLYGLQARLTYNRFILTPDWDEVLGNGAIQFDRLDRLTGYYDDGEVIVKSLAPGEILIYLYPSDLSDPSIRIPAGQGRFLRIYFDVNDLFFEEFTTPINVVDLNFRINLLAADDYHAVLPVLDGATITGDYTVSCPVLFAHNGTEYVRENPLLTACEQTGYAEVVTDYYLIQSPPVDDQGRIRLQLRELEEEVTLLGNFELLTVDHPVGTRVACGVDGRVVTFENTVAPISAIDDQGVDRLAQVVAEDGVMFSADRAGFLQVTFAKEKGNSAGLTVNASEKPACDDPLLRGGGGGITLSGGVENELPGGELIVEVRDASGNWRPLPVLPPRVTETSEFVFGSDESSVDGTMTIRLSWTGSYRTDAVLQLVPQDAQPPVKAARRTESTVGDEFSLAKRAVVLGGTQPVRLAQGDILDLTFETGSSLESGMVRDYIVKAKGRYMPAYMEKGSLPEYYALHRNYPNPFNPSTTIRYDLPIASQVRLEIFNLLGQRVRTLVDAFQEAGNQSVEWNGCDGSGQTVASGVYFYRLTAGDYTASRKMMLLK